MPVSSLCLRVSSVPATSMYSDLLVILTPACLIDSAFASPLLVPLPDLRPSTCVPNLGRIYIEPCRCMPPIGFVCLLLDCHTVYRTRSVKVHSTNLCFRVVMARLDNLAAPSAAPAPSPAPAPLPTTAPPVLPPHLSHPERFSGHSGDWLSFLVQCGLHFECRADKWATAEWARNSPVCSTVQLFTDTLCKTFNHTAPSREAARALMGLRQGNRCVSDYANGFRTLAADSGWNA